MKLAVPVAFLMIWLVTGCGKVGDPHVPTVRTPAMIVDLKAVQNQDRITLYWTNPSKYTDGSNATDLMSVRILQAGKLIATEMVSGAGKPQSKLLDVIPAGTKATYSLEVETQRRKVSEMSNEVPITVVAVPGVVLNPMGRMDQHQIWLEWQAPVQNPAFADLYLVRRDDGTTETVKETHFEDAKVEVGKTFTYIITAARGGTPPVPGPPSMQVVVRAKDETGPAVPTGLQPPIVSDAGAILQWASNTESDLAGYWVWRSSSQDSGFTKLNSEMLTVTSFRDEAYRPGFYYAISAVDESGNESDRSMPVRAP